MVLNLQYIAYISEICSLIESQKWYINLLIVEVDITFKKKINTVTDKIKLQDVLVVIVKIEIVECQGGCKLGPQFVVSFEAELWLKEKHFKLVEKVF
jgi:hypothetical protein